MNRPSRLPIQYRTLRLDGGAVNEETRTVELAFSSETPVERYWGNEILDHGPSAIRLDRLRDGGALLREHDPDRHIGVVETVQIQDRRGHASVRLGRSPLAEEALQDVQDGILRHVSVGYRIHQMVLEASDGHEETYRVTEWEPYEISLVAMPADTTVGVGRSHLPAPSSTETYSIHFEDRSMPPKDPTGASDPIGEATPPVTPPATQRSGADVDAITLQVRADELTRVRTLQAMGQRYARFGGDTLAQAAIAAGHGPDQLRQAILEKLPEQSQAGSGDGPASQLGLSAQETHRYSLMRAIRAAVIGNWKGAEFELRCSQQISEQLGRDARGFFVPFEVQQRVMTASGSALVGTDHLAGSFIDLLRPNSVVLGLGATVLAGLQGNVDIPKQTAGASFSWVAEDGSADLSDAALTSVTLSPKTISGGVPMSRRLLKQSSPDVEAMIQRDLALGCGLAIDLAAMAGSGASNQPLGVKNQVGVSTQTVADATNGIPTWAELVSFETKVAAANALGGRLAYITTPSVRGGMKTTPKVSGAPVFLLDGDQANGYKVETSSQLAAKTILFGDWSSVLIGLWGVLDIVPDNATKAASGGLVLRVFQDLDVNIRHAQSFCVNA